MLGGLAGWASTGVDSALTRAGLASAWAGLPEVGVAGQKDEAGPPGRSCKSIPRPLRPRRPNPIGTTCPSRASPARATFTTLAPVRPNPSQATPAHASRGHAAQPMQPGPRQFSLYRYNLRQQVGMDSNGLQNKTFREVQLAKNNIANINLHTKLGLLP